MQSTSLSRSFPAKVLLFGEYAVLRAGASLAVPFGKYTGRWARHKNSRQHPKQLLQWANYLEENARKGMLQDRYRLAAFRQMLSAPNALSFESNIPIGYGLGSSGALCAAFYHGFSTQKMADDPLALRKELAVLESFFHGQSSGTDPLVSFLGRPILREESGQIKPLSGSGTPSLLRHFYLINSRQARQTEPLVKLFLEKCRSIPSYEQAVHQTFLPATRMAIDALLTNDEQHLAKAIDHISRFQWNYMREMIPPSLHNFWREALASPNHRLKLCGAGGGGFFLLYATDENYVPAGAIPL